MAWIAPNGRCDGIWLSGASPVAAELAAAAGFAWALIDLEHGTASEAEAMAMLQLLSGSGTAAMPPRPRTSPPGCATRRAAGAVSRRCAAPPATVQPGRPTAAKPTRASAPWCRSKALQASRRRT